MGIRSGAGDARPAGPGPRARTSGARPSAPGARFFGGPPGRRPGLREAAAANSAAASTSGSHGPPDPSGSGGPGPRSMATPKTIRAIPSVAAARLASNKSIPTTRRHLDPAGRESDIVCARYAIRDSMRSTGPPLTALRAASAAPSSCTPRSTAAPHPSSSRRTPTASPRSASPPRAAARPSASPARSPPPCSVRSPSA